MIEATRIGAGPISWGICEVPGWGINLPAERVLAEMASIGIHATELGAPGFLPADPHELVEVLDRHDMSLVGGFVPVVLHEPGARAHTLDEATRVADLFHAAGGTMFLSAVVVDEGWAPRLELTEPQWGHLFAMLDELTALCSARGLTHALHPHVGTLVETADDVRRVLEGSDVAWCLDTGHLLIGGYDPAQFAADATGRVAHVHLKDVRGDVAADIRRGAATILDGVRRGLFCPLGDGDAPVAETIRRLESDGYVGMYVLEQDTDLGSSEPAIGTGPIDDVRRSVEFLRHLAPAERGTGSDGLGCGRRP